MDNELPRFATDELEDPIIPVKFEMPISDNRLQMAASVYARQVSSLCCIVESISKWNKKQPERLAKNSNSCSKD